MRRQADLCRRARIYATERGLLAPEEVREGDELDAVLLKLHQERMWSAGDRRRGSAKQIVERAAPLALRGKTIYADGFADAINNHCCRLGIGLVDERVAAACFLVHDFGNLHEHTKWVAALNGCWLLDARYITTDGAQGTAIVYTKAINTKRKVFLSPSFAEAKPAICEIIRTCAGAPASRWELLMTKESFLLAFAAVTSGAKHTWRPMEVLALVTPAIKAKPEWKTAKNVLTPDAFLSFVGQVDEAASSFA